MGTTGGCVVAAVDVLGGVTWVDRLAFHGLIPSIRRDLGMLGRPRIRRSWGVQARGVQALRGSVSMILCGLRWRTLSG